MRIPREGGEGKHSPGPRNVPLNAHPLDADTENKLMMIKGEGEGG